MSQEISSAESQISTLEAELLKLREENSELKKRVGPYRRRLPTTRNSLVHKFSIGGQEGYLSVGLYDDGSPGELFITMSKEGSTVGGMMDTIATLTSLALQSGVSLEVLCNKFKFQKFEPFGMTENKEIPMASSIVDYIFKWMEKRFIPPNT